MIDALRVYPIDSDIPTDRVIIRSIVLTLIACRWEMYSIFDLFQNYFMEILKLIL